MPSVKIFTGIISAVDVDRLSQTAEIKVVDFLDYFGRVTIEETPVWENISLTQLFKNLVELAFPEWVEGTDYFVEDLGGSTIPAIGYTDLNLLSELKMIAESRGKRLYTDADGRLHCASRNPERDPLTVSYNYNLEKDVKERRDINSILNWIVVHARPHEILLDTTPPGKITGFTATPGDQKIDLTWNNPTDDDFEKVMIRFSTTHYPLNREDGTKIYEGAGESKSHTGLTNGTRYYYSGFTVDDVGNWSDAAHTSAVAGLGAEEWADDTPPPPVSYFNAEGEHSKVILTWLNPHIADFDKVVIRRSSTSFPPTPTSGTSIYSGTAETTSDTNVTNGKKYYYSAFVRNTAGRYSSGAYAAATPGAEATQTGRSDIESMNIRGSKHCGTYTDGTCVPGIYFSRYTKTVQLKFRTEKRYSSDWLRFRHEWDIATKSGPAYSSNQKHSHGSKDDLTISSTHDCGGLGGVRLTKLYIGSREVRVEYKFTYAGGKILGIDIRNRLTLRA